MRGLGLDLCRNVPIKDVCARGEKGKRPAVDTRGPFPPGSARQRQLSSLHTTQSGTSRQPQKRKKFPGPYPWPGKAPGRAGSGAERGPALPGPVRGSAKRSHLTHLFPGTRSPRCCDARLGDYGQPAHRQDLSGEPGRRSLNNHGREVAAPFGTGRPHLSRAQPRARGRCALRLGTAAYGVSQGGAGTNPGDSRAVQEADRRTEEDPQLADAKEPSGADAPGRRPPPPQEGGAQAGEPSHAKEVTR